MIPPVANFLDTNILIYAFSKDPRSAAAQALMSDPFALSAQGLNEFANVTHRKLALPWDRVEEAIDALTKAAELIVPVDAMMTKSALDLARRYRFAFYDALMVSAALKAGCSRFYSEDLHHGLRVDEQLDVVNPFLSGAVA
jgi:predicted nucleic acid-binding protein